MIKNVAVKYKKIKLFEGIYIYRFIDVLTNVEYDASGETITYYKDNEKKTIYDMEDLAFTVSDEKMCFSDYIEMDDLKRMYGIEDENTLLEQYKKDCATFIRYGIFDDKEDILKIVSSEKKDIENAKPDSSFIGFSLLSTSDNDRKVFLSYEMVKQYIEQLENNESDKVLRSLCTINESFLSLDSFIEQQIEQEVQEELKEQEEPKKENTIELDDLVGLENIKKEVKKLKAYLTFLNKQKENINLEMPNLNMVFYGNPGTGKTTIARIISKILYSLGYIKSDKFKEATTGDFIASYVGQTAPKTQKLLSENRGGVIFIDEAYSFASKAQEFADEAIVEILKEMEKRETVFIFAGYTDEMKNFIEMNPGFKSRVSNYMEFSDYTIEELMEIFMKKIIKSKLKITDEAQEKVKEVILKAKHMDQFGNGRFIDQLFNKIMLYHAINVENITDSETACTITEEDIDKEIYRELDIQSKQKSIGFKGGN